MLKRQLNKNQAEAVEYTAGPLLIVAGAGTGKTTVITEKIVSLIERKLAKPEQILALTFTDKAAHDVQERVDELLDTGYTDMCISTFHAFCQRILERYALDIGLPNHFKLFSDVECWLMVRANLDKFKLDYYRPLGNPTKFIHELIKHFNKCKDELISPEDYLAYADSLSLDADDAEQQEKNRVYEISNAYHTYNQLLLESGALDFADLIYYVIKLVNSRPKILQTLQNQFKFVLVDEFQDVNWSQYKLVQLLTNKECQLTVVGDDDQSIYAFRGASVANILRFKDDYPNCKEIVLNENYRSPQEVLDLAYKSIQNNNPDRLEVKLSIDKRLESRIMNQESGVVNVTSYATSEEEVQGVISKINKLKEENIDAMWNDFVILVRANGHAEPFMNALESARIPYEFMAASGLFRQTVVLDCVNFFKLVDNYHESSAIYRLLRLPFFQFKENDLQKITFAAHKKSISYYETLKRAAEFHLSEDGIAVCEKLVNLVHTGMQDARNSKPTLVLFNFLENSGYLAYLAKKEEVGKNAGRQINFLKQFFSYLDSYEQSQPEAHVSLFMEHYKYVNQAGEDGHLATTNDDSEAVKIMTVHGAKGLEFKYVFVINLVEERFPTRFHGGGIEIPLALVKEQLPEGDIHYEEERRLFYVAITRAKERLYLTHANDYGGVRKKKISRFLDELGFKSAVSEKQSSSETMKPFNNLAIKQFLPQTDPTPAENLYPTPATFSFSQIRSYQTCPYQYKLAHILKIPSKGNASFSFGQTMHSTLQEFYERVQTLNNVRQESLFGPLTVLKFDGEVKVPPLEELIEIYKQKWMPDWYTSKKQREDYFKKGQEILTIFYKSQTDNWTIPAVLEGWFNIKVGDYHVHGRIDRIDTKPDGTTEIIDYKTGASKEKVVGEEKDQLLIYQIAAETLPEYTHLGKPGKLTFYYLNDNLQTSFVGKGEELDKLRQKIMDTVEKIKSGNFKATPNSHVCSHCDFRDICEYRA